MRRVPAARSSLSPEPVDVASAEAHHRREGFTMALYASITLLGALTVVTGGSASNRDVFAVVWGTTVGLALAHWFAFGLAVRLVDPSSDRSELDRHLAVVLGAAAVVALHATVPEIVLPDDLERAGARFVAAGCIGVAAFAQSRAFGASMARSSRVALIALLLGVAVAGVKHALGH